MARQLQALFLTLSLDAESYELRDGDSVGNCPRSDADAVVWDLAAATYRKGDAEDGTTWAGTLGDRFTARATLLESSTGTYSTDTDYDVTANGPRTARTPSMAAAGLRAWLGAELHYDAPHATTTVSFRVYDVDQAMDLWWTGSEWAEATNAATHWNTGQELQDNLAALPGSVRQVAVVAWLSTTDEDYAPSFYGVSLAYGVRWVSSEDDALIRTLLASLQGELGVTGVLERDSGAGLASIDLASAGEGPGELAYEVTAVDAVFNLTDDPYELVELPGSLAGGVWTPTTPIAASKVIRLEFTYAPDLVFRRHQDLVELSKLPAILLGNTGTRSVDSSGDAMVVRDLNASPPTALELPAPDLVRQPVELRMLAELGSDVQRMGQALARWLSTRPDGSSNGHGAARRLVSPETGQAMLVQSVTQPAESSAALAQGVAEARAGWLLTFPRATAQTTTTAPLIAASGISLTISE